MVSQRFVEPDHHTFNQTVAHTVKTQCVKVRAEDLELSYTEPDSDPTPLWDETERRLNPRPPRGLISLMIM